MEDFAGRLALSCKRRRALGAVKPEKRRLLMHLVLLPTLRHCPIGLAVLKIRQVRKEAAVIEIAGVFG